MYHFPRFFFSFSMLAHEVHEAENDTKLKNLTFDLNLLLAPTRAHQVCICICFLGSVHKYFGGMGWAIENFRHKTF